MNKKELSELRRDRIGFVFQAYNLMPVLTAYENAEMVLWVQGVDGPTRRERVMALLERVGLKGMEDRRPSELSGGQQQRASRSPAPLPATRRWCWPTSRPRTSIRRRRRRCSD